MSALAPTAAKQTMGPTRSHLGKPHQQPANHFGSSSPPTSAASRAATEPPTFYPRFGLSKVSMSQVDQVHQVSDLGQRSSVDEMANRRGANPASPQLAAKASTKKRPKVQQPGLVPYGSSSPPALPSPAPSPAPPALIKPARPPRCVQRATSPAPSASSAGSKKSTRLSARRLAAQTSTPMLGLGSSSSTLKLEAIDSCTDSEQWAARAASFVDPPTVVECGTLHAAHYTAVAYAALRARTTKLNMRKCLGRYQIHQHKSGYEYQHPLGTQTYATLEEAIDGRDQAERQPEGARFSNVSAHWSGPAHPLLEQQWPFLAHVQVQRTETQMSFVVVEQIIGTVPMPAVRFTAHRGGAGPRLAQVAGSGAAIRIEAKPLGACWEIIARLGYTLVPRHVPLPRPQEAKMVQQAATLQSYLESICCKRLQYDPAPDGHCGFRAVAQASMGSEDEQQWIRQRCHCIVLDHPALWSGICAELLEPHSSATQELLYVNPPPGPPGNWGWFNAHLHSLLVASAFDSVVVTIVPASPQAAAAPLPTEQEDDEVVIQRTFKSRQSAHQQ
ncbi:hypothetical protein IE81DRAFT_348958 [Ceraceosorus guamensis]|uniref:OTU domain-containing protein n=1 Tax=Ceraceosorus guamensis TaxID=1522189 RepID=A0A316VWB7_9BASI|nr:hypothetical protein IE81DRAFT_348958 [Ceraceosorus guamensis]PWN40733.1 hypothetical protein IE81DRAFT_348958 [Ceraceosorus guamensis]